MVLREATDSDVPAVVALINQAFSVEAFFKIGDRTNPVEVCVRMTQGRFLVFEDGAALAACVFVAAHGDRGYFGTLSVDPSQQGRGLGSRMVAAAEQWCRERGCREIEIEVVNLRTELPPYYRRLGYVEQGTRTFPDSERATQPCHFIVMTKALSQ